MIGGKISISASESIDIQAPSINVGTIGGEYPTTTMSMQAQKVTHEAEINMDVISPTLNIGKDGGTTNTKGATINIDGTAVVAMTAPVINAN
jgi:hypothetical protein